jgi:hypothetical protein
MRSEWRRRPGVRETTLPLGPPGGAVTFVLVVENNDTSTHQRVVRLDGGATSDAVYTRDSACEAHAKSSLERGTSRREGTPFARASRRADRSVTSDAFHSMVRRFVSNVCLLCHDRFPSRTISRRAVVSRSVRGRPLDVRTQNTITTSEPMPFEAEHRPKRVLEIHGLFPLHYPRDPVGRRRGVKSISPLACSRRCRHGSPLGSRTPPSVDCHLY